MCLTLNQTKLKQLKKRKTSVIGYKIVKVDDKGKLFPAYEQWSDTPYETKVKWDKKYIFGGFSVFLDKKVALHVLKNCRILKKYQDIKTLHIYKVKCTQPVAIGTWKYETEPHPFNDFTIAQFKQLQFMEKIS